MRRFLSLLVLVPIAAHAGPISKFDNKKPTGVYETRQTIDQVERCLIDISNYGSANVYRQSDRPGSETLIWSSGTGVSVGRVDLVKTADGAKITSWFDEKQVAACASRQ
jgi:hypothetical protein